MAERALLKGKQVRPWHIASGDDAEFYLSLWSWRTAKVKKAPCPKCPRKQLTARTQIPFLDTPASPPYLGQGPTGTLRIPVVALT